MFSTLTFGGHVGTTKKKESIGGWRQRAIEGAISVFSGYEEKYDCSNHVVGGNDWSARASAECPERKLSDRFGFGRACGGAEGRGDQVQL
jgi:hypothetical protein